ncbi:MAG: TPM domain-containing protein [Acetatifactor sp.]|nr:TPM domain-containing protein [Acetatifactor sp.]
MRRVGATFLAVFLLFMTSVSVVCATTGEIYTNPETGYRVILEDKAELLTEGERGELTEQMRQITAYGNVAFVTIGENYRDTDDYAAACFRDLFGRSSGTLFLIDMDNRNIWVYSDGAIYRVVTKSYANTITDNVYRYASRGEYYECAAEVYQEIFALLEGDRIAQPMKYISNVFLALILALFVNFGLVSWMSRLRKPKDAELLSNSVRYFHVTEPTITYAHETKTYDPVSSDSGSSGGGSGGGGGHSGGGGGHSF